MITAEGRVCSYSFPGDRLDEKLRAFNQVVWRTRKSGTEVAVFHPEAMRNCPVIADEALLVSTADRANFGHYLLDIGPPSILWAVQNDQPMLSWPLAPLFRRPKPAAQSRQPEEPRGGHRRAGQLRYCRRATGTHEFRRPGRDVLARFARGGRVRGRATSMSVSVRLTRRWSRSWPRTNGTHGPRISAACWACATSSCSRV